MKSERAGSRLSPVLAADCRNTSTLNTRYTWLLTMNWAVNCCALPFSCYLPVDEVGGGGSKLQRCCQSHYILRHVLVLSLTDGMSSRVRDRVFARSACTSNAQSFVFYINLTLTRHYHHYCHHCCSQVTSPSPARYCRHCFSQANSPSPAHYCHDCCSQVNLPSPAHYCHHCCSHINSPSPAH